MKLYRCAGRESSSGAGLAAGLCWPARPSWNLAILQEFPLNRLDGLSRSWRMKKVLWMAVLAAGLVAGCETAPPADVVARTDEVTGRQSHLITDNIVEDPAQSDSLLWLNASQLFTYRGVARYYLEVRFQARPERGLIEISPGQSLTVTADGAPIRLSGPGSAKFRKEKYGTVIETAVYSIDLPQLEKIAKAKDVRVRVSGAKGFVERNFAAKNFENFREFTRLVQADAAAQ
jgi:hypothetical protein